jgi:hypothetical protein
MPSGKKHKQIPEYKHKLLNCNPNINFNRVEMYESRFVIQ